MARGTGTKPLKEALGALIVLEVEMRREWEAKIKVEKDPVRREAMRFGMKHLLLGIERSRGALKLISLKHSEGLADV